MQENQASNSPEVFEEDYIKALRYWRKFPSTFIDDMFLEPLDIVLEPRQRIALETIFRDRKVLIPTHFAFGKSFLCALIALAIPNLWPNDCIGSTFAPTFRQVRDILWREMNKVFEILQEKNPDAIAGNISTTRYSIGTGALVVGFSPNKGAKGGNSGQSISGRHAEVVFIIVDEAGGVAKQVFEQIEALQSSGVIVFVIYIGNPLDPNGEFGQLCNTAKGEGFTVLHYTAYTHANMIANGLTSIKAIRKEGSKLRALSPQERKEYYEDKYYIKPYPTLISPGFVMKCYLKWGESPLFFSYCIGEWAQTLDDTLVTLARANEVMMGSYLVVDGHGEPEKDKTGKATGRREWYSELNKYATYNGVGEIYLGLDCSSEGADSRVLFGLEGNRQFCFKKFDKTWEKNDLDYRGTALKEDGLYVASWIYDNVFKPNPGRVFKLGIDCTGGFGDSVYEALLRYDLDPNFITITKIHFSQSAIDKRQFFGIISEMAFLLADQINSKDGLLLEQNDDLKNQLTNRKKTRNKSFQRLLETKEKYKARAGQSPDDFDALMISNYMAKKSQQNDEVKELEDYIDKMQQSNEKQFKQKRW